MPRKKDNEIPLLIPQGNYLTEKLKFNTFQTMTSMRNVDAEYAANFLIMKIEEI